MIGFLKICLSVTPKPRKELVGLRAHLKATTSAAVTRAFRVATRQQDLPAEGHQLVVAQARKRRAQPDEEEDQRQQLEHEPERAEGAHGPSQPPKKSVTQRPESVIMFTYSAIEKRPKRMPLYSVW